MPAELVEQLQKWSEQFPALLGVVQAVVPKPQQIVEYRALELDRLASQQQTELARHVEAAAKAERLAHQDVQWKPDRVNKTRLLLGEQEEAHADALRLLQSAQQEKLAAEQATVAFNPGQFKKDKQDEIAAQRQAQAQAEAAAAAQTAQRAQGACAHGAVPAKPGHAAGGPVRREAGGSSPD
eukprot:5759631-Pyramimonas_sp.AAC.1